MRKIEVWVAYDSNSEWVRVPSLTIEPKENWEEMQVPLLQLRGLQEDCYAIRLKVRDHIFHMSRFQDAVDFAMQENLTK
ncbi:MAG: hypothetical protein K1X66_04060 [Verrucomicrobiae bacterium]|nr:hypothetical protein [Verrucomicrobiae bacterium]